VAGLLFVAALCVPAGAPAQQLDGRAIVSWRSYDTGGLTNQGLHQTYELRLLQALSELIGFRISFRAERADDTFETGSQSLSSSFLRLQPGGELLITLPQIQLQARYDLIRTTFGSAASADQRFERQTLHLAWQPDRFPSLTLDADRRVLSDTFHEQDSTETLLQATVSETLGPVQLAAAGRSTLLEESDDRGSAQRRSIEAQGTAAFNDAFWAGRLVASGDLNVIAARIDERAGAEGTLAQPVRIGTASAGIDDTPLDARDRPPAPAPALIDGAFLPSGLSIGPSDQSFLNIALDFRRFVLLDELRLLVRDRSGSLVPAGGSIEWNVYVSSDALDWTPLSGGAQTRFDPARSLYEVTFERSSTRFLKVVNLGVNVLETELVEVQAFDHLPGEPGERLETDLRIASAHASLTARPAEWLAVSWNGLWNLSRQTREDEPDLRSEDSDQLASVLIRPASWTELLLRYQWRDVTQSEGFGQDFDQWIADLRFVPRPALDVTIEAFRSRENSTGRRTEIDGLALRGHTRLWRAIDLNFDLGQNWEELLSEGLTAERRFANGSALLRLTPAWTLTGSVALSRTRFEGEPQEGVAPASGSDRRWTTELAWRPGPPLLLSARIGRASATDFSTSLRGFRVQWNPFTGGALSLASAYDEDVDTATRRTFRRLLLSPRWAINRRASLQLNYTLADLSGATSQRTRTLFATFTLDL
jgi:hypothetical protein